MERENNFKYFHSEMNNTKVKFSDSGKPPAPNFTKNIIPNHLIGRTDIVELNEDDELRVFGAAGTKLRDVSLMGMLLRPRIFMTPGTTF